MSHLPCRLAAKLKGVPKTQTRMSLRLMFNRITLMGVHRLRNLAKMSRARKLLRIPATKMKPRHTATTVCPVRLSPPGLWDTGEPSRVATVLRLELERELSVVLKLQPRKWTTIAERERGSRGDKVLHRYYSCSSEGRYVTVIRVRRVESYTMHPCNVC